MGDTAASLLDPKCKVGIKKESGKMNRSSGSLKQVWDRRHVKRVDEKQRKCCTSGVSSTLKFTQRTITSVSSKENDRSIRETGHLGVQPGRGRKSTRSDVVEDVVTAIVDQSMDNVIGCSSARTVSRHLGVPYSTVWNVLRKVVHFFPYKIRHNQQFMANDREKRLTFALTFLARVEVDASWPWKIQWSDEANFHISGTVNTHNCHIWNTENPRTFQEIPLHSLKVTVWCEFTATFILGTFFFEETTRNGPVTCTVNPGGRLITLADLKDSITLHVRIIYVSTNYDQQLNKLSTDCRFYILKKGTVLSSIRCIDKI
ncbi:uncharacterized protein TNCV_4521961 [Trichonephila clavipes]|nr:uncharacterized protein TNCV_4521961 [Trichonephila clavipes]